MRHRKHQIITCYLLAFFIIFSGLFMGIAQGQSPLSYNNSKNSYSDFCIPDTNPVSISDSRRNAETPSLSSRQKANYDTQGAFKGIFAGLTNTLQNQYYSSYFAMASVGICNKLHSHLAILDFIHQKDGKK